MKIIFSVFQPIKNETPQSGVGKIAYQLFSYLEPKYDINIFFSNKGKIKNKHVKDFGIIFKILNRIIAFCNRFLPYYIIRHFQEILYDLFLRIHINKTIDILISTNAWIPKTAWKAKKWNIKIIFIAGNPNDNYIYNLLKNEKNKLGIKNHDAFDSNPRLNAFNQFFKNTDIVLCINQYIYESFIPNDEISPKYKLIPTIFDANFKIFDIKKKHSNYFTVFYCAHTTTLKGLQYLLPAFNIFQKNKSNVQLFIGGTIDKGVFNLISKSLNDNIRLLGSLESIQIAEQLKQTSVFVVPSLTDAAPVTMIEAMYSKTPIICSDGVGHQWLIEEGVNGYLYDKYSIEQLVEKLERCYNNIENLQIMGENARITIDNAIINKRNFNYRFEKLIKR